jgi:membrane associated rhomboid family serine protease
MTRALARLLMAGLDAWIGLLELFGAGGTHWEWRKRAWRLALETRVASWENVERGVAAPMRMCASCRTLIPRRERVCPACGASMRGVPGGGIGRALGLLFPGTPSMTVLIVGANVAMSLFILVQWGAAPGAGLFRFLSPPLEALYLLGGMAPGAVDAGQVWRLVTANYLHGGLLHLLLNGYALMVLGPLVEEAFGWRKFFCLYTLSGIAGFLVSFLWHHNETYRIAIGASGAIYGLLGFAVIYGRFRAGPAGRAIAAHLTQWLVFGLVMFLIPGIDSSAHVGGVAFGMLAGLFLEPREPRTPAANAGWWLLTGVVIVLTFGSFAAMALAYPETLRQLSR